MCHKKTSQLAFHMRCTPILLIVAGRHPLIKPRNEESYLLFENNMIRDGRRKFVIVPVHRAHPRTH